MIEAVSKRQRLIAELRQNPDPAARRGILRTNRELHDPAVVDLLYDEVVRLARLDVQQAARVAQSALWIAEKLRDDYCRAQGMRAAGHVLLMRGKYPAAVRAYGDALDLFRRLGRDAEAGRTLYGGSLQALIYLGQYEQALAWAEEAREIFERLGDRLRLARLDTNVGNILYRQDRFEEALACYRRAYKRFVRQSEPEDIAITLRNMAVCYISLANFAKAMETYREARAHCEQANMPLLVAEADYNIAYLHFQRGEYARAVELYQSARQHCQRLGDPYHKALCDLDQAEMYLELNLEEEGAQLADLAATAFRDLGMRYEEAKGLTFLAVAASHQGRVGRALELYRSARSLFVREHNRVWVALIDLYRAVVLYQEGRYSRAWRLRAAAFSFFSGSSLRTKSALCELLRARLHLQAREYTEARGACLAALKILGRTESPAVRCQAHLVLGQVLEAQANRRGAYRSYKKAHALLENLRSRLGGEELKIAFLRDKLAVYESLVSMSLGGAATSRSKEAAFAYIEQAKSRSLADLIVFRELDLPARKGPRSRPAERARRLRAVLNWHYRQLELMETGQLHHSQHRLEGMRRITRDYEEKLVSALADLRSSDDRSGAFRDAHPIGLSAIRSVIPEDTVLLEYYQAREVVHACVLSRDSLEIIPVADAAEVRASLRLLQFQLSKFRLGPEYVRRFAETLQTATLAHLRELHRKLIAPVRSLLRAAHLVVVPHDFLHYLPFHALNDGSRSLVEEFSISYAPSASVYYLCSSKAPSSTDGSLVLGIPDLQTPHILEEVKQVADLLPGSRLFVGEAATEERLREYGPRCRFIHIATHGLFRQDNPMFSSMKLGDSQLSLLDLYSLELSSELVTLSGCSTGMNAVVGADELLGLVRGLLYAGTRGVLVTLWDVDDRSTADFMSLFYRHLSSGSDKASAVQRAMRELREHYPHPYHWAPFVLVAPR